MPGFLRIDAWVACSRMGARRLSRVVRLLRTRKGEGVGQHGADGFGKLTVDHQTSAAALAIAARSSLEKVTLRNASSFGSPSSLGSAAAKS